MLVIGVGDGRLKENTLGLETQELGSETSQPYGRQLRLVISDQDQVGTLGDGQVERPIEEKAELLTATHYGKSYEGQPLGCGLLYHSDDPGILAVGPSRYTEWPCGTRLLVCGESSPSLVVTGQNTVSMWVPRCISVVRVDSCPGCGHWLVDLSETGIEAVCPGQDVCQVWIEREGYE